MLTSAKEERRAPDFTLAAEAAYDWFTAHGARFFRTPLGEPFMFFADAILWMDTPDRGRKRLYASLMYKHTGMVQTTGGGTEASLGGRPGFRLSVTVRIAVDVDTQDMM